MNAATLRCAVVISLVSLLCSCVPPSISDGKFYLYCPSGSCTPNSSILDINSSPMGFTAGTKLTDGAVALSAAGQPADTWYWGSDDPGQHVERDKWVAWFSVYNISVVVDLGKPYPISEFSLDSTSYSPFGILYPSIVSVYVSATNPNPGPGTSSYSAVLSAFPSNCTSSCPPSWQIPRRTAKFTMPTGTTVTGRYVNFAITAAAPSANTLIDEVSVRGAIDNPQRFVPAANQVYHGAFAVTPPEGAGYGLNIPYFETLVGKPLATYLWYGNWVGGYNQLQQLIAANPTKALQFAVVPGDEITPPAGGTYLDAILSGSQDAALSNFFSAAAQQLGSGGGKLNMPIFFRLMPEMNWSGQVWSGANNGGAGGGPQKYVAAWRRIYNLAQRLGATNPGNVLFVWAPNSVSDPGGPGNEWNGTANYYPGDQYVEWVGLDFYEGVPDGQASNSGEGQEPSVYIQPIYSAYAGRKPMMLGETGGCPSMPAPLGTPNDAQPGNDKAVFVNHLFSQLASQFPNIKAVTWFNAYDRKFCDFNLDSSQDVPLHSALNEYRSQIGAARYVSSIQGN